MGQTTVAKASKCPKCNQQGDKISEKPSADPKYVVHVYQCNYKLCTWYDTTWIVAVDEDGVVPERDIGHIKKAFPKLPEITDAQHQKLLEDFDDLDPDVRA
jgi:hypothetical protein